LTAPTGVHSTFDLGGLERLRHSAAGNGDPAVLAEAAVQFEALFIGLMLETARSASLGDGAFDSQETEQYLSLMDQQVALEMARRGGFGFGSLLTEQLGGSRPAPHAGFAPQAPTPAPADRSADFPAGLPASLRELAPPSDDSAAADSPPDEFVARRYPDAKRAADVLGVDPRLLLAQAALETGWGRSAAGDAAANNFFGIKAGASWQGPRAVRFTVEHEDGTAVSKREPFRAYATPAESFADYVELMSRSPRYRAALESASDAEAFARAVSSAGYATDPEYAEKWLGVYHGDRLDAAMRRLKNDVTEPTP
jgi:peptidoglycan hydrolase FlgJ